MTVRRDVRTGFTAHGPITASFEKPPPAARAGIFGQIVRYGLTAAAVSGGAFALNAYDDHQAGHAFLAARLPEYPFYLRNEVRAQGLAPLYRGEPAYPQRMDGGSDGVACEPYR